MLHGLVVGGHVLYLGRSPAILFGSWSRFLPGVWRNHSYEYSRSIIQSAAPGDYQILAVYSWPIWEGCPLVPRIGGLLQLLGAAGNHVDYDAMASIVLLYRG